MVQKILYFFMDLSISNAFACYKADYPQNTMDFLQFKTDVAHSLMISDEGLPRQVKADVHNHPQQSTNFVPEDTRLNRLHHYPAWVHGGKDVKVYGKNNIIIFFFFG